MERISFEKLVDSENHRKDGYYLKDVAFIRNGKKAHRTLLLDTGASWTTVSKVVAKQLDIDYKKEENSELRRLWDQWGSESPYTFLHNTWKNYEARSISVTSRLANGEEKESFLYPIDLKLMNGFESTAIVNIMPQEVDTPMYGVQPLMRYASSLELTDNGNEITATFDDSAQINQRI